MAFCYINAAYFLFSLPDRQVASASVPSAIINTHVDISLNTTAINISVVSLWYTDFDPVELLLKLGDAPLKCIHFFFTLGLCVCEESLYACTMAKARMSKDGFRERVLSFQHVVSERQMSTHFSLQLFYLHFFLPTVFAHFH